MSVSIRPYRRGGWEVDIRVVTPDGVRQSRERKLAPVSSRSAAVRWAEGRERVLFDRLMRPPQEVTPPKEVPTLREFAARFVDGHARANRQKPSGIAAKEMIIRVHLVPPLGHKKLDAIKSEDVQLLKTRLSTKAAKTVNNILTVLNVLLKKAVEWDVIDRMPCAISLLPVPKTVDVVLRLREYERLVTATRSRRGNRAPHRAPRRRGRASVRRDDRARVERRRSRQAATLRPAVGLERPGDDAEGRAAAVRAADDSTGGRVSGASASAERACAVLRTDGKPLTRQIVQYRLIRAAASGEADAGGCSSSCVTRSARTWRCEARRRGRSRNWPDTGSWA